jgi:Protein of unknown function (DUF3307)
MLVMVTSTNPGGVSRPVVFLVALVVLVVAHQVGDHVLQTDRQAANKAGPGLVAARAMAGHLLTYHAAAALLLVGTFAVLRLPLGVPGLLAGLAFSAATHGWLDRRWPVRGLLRAMRAPKFAEATTPVFGLYQADQALHQLALLVCALLICVV